MEILIWLAQTMITALRSVLFLLVVVALPLTALGEIYECDGRWTNVPCKGKTTRTVEAASKRKVMTPEQARSLGDKRSLFHELNMKAIKASRDFDLRFDLKEIERVCLEPFSSLEECRMLTESADNRISEKITESKQLAEQRRLAEAQEESNKLQQEANDIAIEHNNIELLQDRSASDIHSTDQRVYINSNGDNNQIVVDQKAGRHRHRHRHDRGDGDGLGWYEQGGSTILWKRSGSGKPPK
jgi:hypothetical protein